MSQFVSASTVPPRLRPGDTVAVCAPAGPVDATRLDAGVAVLEGRYRVRFERERLLERDGFFAGSDARRAAELDRAFADPEVRAVVMARGGYGLTRILPLVDHRALAGDPIPVVGFSDGTALLSWSLVAAGVRSIHGPVVGQLGGLDDVDHQALFDLLERPEPPGEIASGLRIVGAEAEGEVSGALIGGNLCLLSHLIATPWIPPLDGALLLIEEVGERPYAIDRYLTHLFSAGLLSGVRGVVVGDFVGCGEPKIEDSPDALAVIDERLRHFGLPGVVVPGIGHGDGNRALPFGGRASIDFDRRALSVSEAAVR